MQGTFNIFSDLLGKWKTNSRLQALTVFCLSHGLAASAYLAVEHARTPKVGRHRSVLPRLSHACDGNSPHYRDGEVPPRGDLAVHFSADRSCRNRRISAGLLIPRL